MRNTRLLVIDDDEELHQLIDFCLGNTVDVIHHAFCGAQGVEFAVELKPDVILLAVNLEGMDGFEVCNKIKATKSGRHTPVIFLTRFTNPEHIAKGLNFGGYDCVKKPFEPVELKARIEAALRTQRLFQMLQRQATIDALTGLGNQAYFLESLNKAVSRYLNEALSFSVLLLGIDDLAEINSKHGYGVGDEMLMEVASLVSSQFLYTADTVARYQKGSFAVIYRTPVGLKPEKLAQQLIDNITSTVIMTYQKPLRVIATAGLLNLGLPVAPLVPQTIIGMIGSVYCLARDDGPGSLHVATYPEEKQSEAA